MDYIYYIIFLYYNIISYLYKSYISNKIINIISTFYKIIFNYIQDDDFNPNLASNSFTLFSNLAITKLSAAL